MKIGIRTLLFLVLWMNGFGSKAQKAQKEMEFLINITELEQGRGLVLSLSYTIIKAHGGEMLVETEEGSGANFIIQIPVVGNH